MECDKCSREHDLKISCYDAGYQAALDFFRDLNKDSFNKLKQLRLDVFECNERLGSIEGLGMYPEVSRVYKRFKQLSKDK